MKRKLLQSFLLGAVLLVCFGFSAEGQRQNWLPVGPDGGDARSFAVDPGNPQHIYLGTTTSWVYQSLESWSSCKLLEMRSKSDNIVVDSLVVEPSSAKSLFAGV